MDVLEKNPVDYADSNVRRAETGSRRKTDPYVRSVVTITGASEQTYSQFLAPINQSEIQTMPYPQYTDEELIELYVRTDAVVQDPVYTDLTSMQQMKAIGDVLEERGISAERIEETYTEMEEKGLFDDPYGHAEQTS